MKIIQHPDLAQARKDASDWEQGYAYQMWRCRYNAYRGDGAFGQLMIVMPDQDAVLAITAETSDMQGEINLVWRYLLPAMTVGKLPANKIAYAQLQTALKELALPPATNSSVSEKRTALISWKPISSISVPPLSITNNLRLKTIRPATHWILAPEPGKQAPRKNPVRP
ncbi:hypothetical protein [Mucilaginibacter antarcticus]|uniref:hypothetical protein n=1 Tax=Mucilaginibacter antarcticus TaxID=1855725 RepID=UPI003626152C